MTAFQKILSRNDASESGSHQAGILVPKCDDELLSFFPSLNGVLRNADTILLCIDEAGQGCRFRYVYYNKQHEPKGMRNEYLITRMTTYLRSMAACAGDRLLFESIANDAYKASLQQGALEKLGVTKLFGWRRVH